MFSGTTVSFASIDGETVVRSVVVVRRVSDVLFSDEEVLDRE
jgi:hypothetical protein